MNHPRKTGNGPKRALHWRLFPAATAAFFLAIAVAVGAVAETDKRDRILRSDAANGRRLYSQFCTPCHGPKGNGRGFRARKEMLRPPPRDHANGFYMNMQPTVRFFKVIKFGGAKNGLAHIMPQWGHILSDRQILDVIAHIRTLADPPWTPLDAQNWGRDPFSDQEMLEKMLEQPPNP